MARKKEKRGGAREGSGAKPLHAGQRRVQLSLSVTPKTLETFDDFARGEQLSRGRAFDWLMCAAYPELKKLRK
jgi:hypothetical protein